MGAHVVASLRMCEEFMSNEIENSTVVAYVKDDTDSGTTLIVNLFDKDGTRWVGLSLSKGDERTAIMMPYRQWQEMVKDMMRR